MIRNYLLVAWRNLVKNKSFSIINILGLALGITCSLLIMLWVKDEYSVDAFHRNGSRIYSVYERTYFDGKVTLRHNTPGIMAPEMKRVLPEVMHATGFAWNHYATFAAGEKIMKAQGNWAGEDYFSIFSFPLLEGSAGTALNSPVSIAISRNLAENFFGSPAAAIGKTLRYENSKELKVTAVFENVPDNASTRFDFLLNWDLFLEKNEWAKEWGNNGPFTFVLLRPDTDPAAFEARIEKFLDHYNKEQDASFRIELGIQRYGDMYLYSQTKDGRIAGGRIEYVRLFSIVAVFILLIACINFMNLTSARSIKRAKEIGVRKVVGASRLALVKQFIGEAVLLTVLASVMALLLVALILPVFNGLTGKHIRIPFNDLSFWATLLALIVVTGLLSGSYPAILSSAFNPVSVLKSKLRMGSGVIWLRKGLVVFQFALSILLITGMIVIQRQVNFLHTKNLGYAKENLLFLPLKGELVSSYQVFKEEALRLPGVTGITRMVNRPVHIENGTGGVDWDGKDPNTRPMFTQVAVGYDFVKSLQLPLVQGRDFSPKYGTDSAGFIVNETALRRIGYTDPIGKRLTFWGNKGQIIGVVKDFHFNSLHVPIQPLIIWLNDNDDGGYAVIRTEPGKIGTALTGLEKLCKQLNPAFPFSHQFADDEYAALYQREKVINELSRYFAFLGIFISCLGLLGLVIFTAGQRDREFSIRKVLGASPASLFGLLSRDFLALIAIALLIAVPLAWWAMSNWLQNYEYHIPISWSVFAVAGLGAFAIALLTISFQAVRAALANPVNSLRAE